MTTSRLAIGAAVLALAAPLVVAAVSLAAGLLTPAYDPVRSSVSYLAGRGQPYATALNGAFVLLGISLAALAWALDRHLDGRARAGCLLLATAGIGLLAVALVARDPAHPQVTSTHRLLAAAAFTAWALAPLLVGLRLPRSRFAAASLAIAALSLALLAAGGIALPRHLLPGGAWERALAAVELTWVCLVAVRLLGTPRTP